MALSLANVIGVEGVLLGTIVGNIYHWYKRAYYTYERVLLTKKNGLLDYLSTVMKHMAFFLVIWMGLAFAYEWGFKNNSIFCMVIKVLIAIMCVAAGHLVCFRNSKEFAYMMGLIKKENK